MSWLVIAAVLVLGCGRLHFDLADDDGLGGDARGGGNGDGEPDGMVAAGSPDVEVASSLASEPVIAWNGSEAGIAWTDQRLGPFQVFFDRRDLDGNEVGTEHQLSTGAVGGSNPAMVWNGSRFGIVWTDSRDGNDEIYFSAVDASGASVGVDQVRITNNPSEADHATLCWDGTRFVIAWEDDRNSPTGNFEIYVAAVDANGTKTTGDVRVTNQNQKQVQPSIAWTGTEYAVSWIDTRSGALALYLAMVDPALSGVIPTGAVISSTDTTGSGLAWNGTTLDLAWGPATATFTNTLWLARFDGAGGVVESPRQIGPDAYSNFPTIIAAGTNFAVARASSAVDIPSQRPSITVIAGDGTTKISEQPFSMVAGGQFAAIAWTGDRYVAAFEGPSLSVWYRSFFL